MFSCPPARTVECVDAALELVPIGQRIEEHLTALGKNAEWLAETILVAPSSVSRFLKGTRTPSAETLHDIATALGMSVAQLVHGTNAAARVEEARNIVSRREYDEAIAKVVEYDRRVNELIERERNLRNELRHETEMARRAREDLEACRVERARADRKARHYESETARYREGLEKAVADVAKLQASVDAGRTIGGVAAACAIVAAGVSIANYLRDEPEGDDHDNGEDPNKA